MSPLPTTPAPQRFLLPKRAVGLATRTPPVQFASTPRFSAASTPWSTQRRGREVEDVEEDDGDGDVEEDDGDEERVGESEVEGATGSEEGGNVDDRFGIEDDESQMDEGFLQGIVSDGMTAEREGGMRSSSPRDEEMDGEGYDDLAAEPFTPSGRAAKRRKVSISPMRESPSPIGEAEEDLGTSPQHSPREEEDGHLLYKMHDDEHIPKAISTTKIPPQPTFQPAPRFKPVEPDAAAEGLPAAFSPQHRRARFLAGGLAAEMQGYLSAVKGVEAGPGSAASRVMVREVRPGRRMYLVRAVQVDDDDRLEGNADEDGTESRFILAGDGKLTGLGRRAVVGVGCVVVVERPVWRVELEGSVWTVACNWSVDV